MDLIEFNDGTFSFAKGLSKNEFLEKVRGLNYEIIYKEQFGIEVYYAGKEVLVADNDYYTQYESVQDFEKALSERNDPVKGQEIMFKKNEFGETFPKHTKELIKTLFSILSLNQDEKIDPLLLLERIENKLTVLDNPLLFYRKYFLNFVALLGEIMIEDCSASWDLRLSTDGVTWNPFLQIQKKSIPIFSRLYEALFFDHNTDDPLRSNVIICNANKYRINHY